MKFKYLGIALLALCAGCDNTTDQMGLTTLPGGDKITVSAENYTIQTKSVLSGPVYARSNELYLGKYTDKRFGTFQANFATQFYCTDNYEPYVKRERILASTINTELQLAYLKSGGYFGDPLNTCGLNVYKLNKNLPDEKENYYSNFNPADYCNLSEAPLAKAVYSARDFSVSDEDWENTNNKVAGVRVELPKSLGDDIVNLSKSNPEYFKNSATFAEHILKGIYVETVHGDGTVLYLNNLVLNVLSDVYAVDSDGNFPIKRKAVGHEEEDSIVSDMVIGQFAATKEVAHANRFINNDTKLQSFVDDNTCTYIKSPAGIFTEATLPLQAIYDTHKNDTINAASFTLHTYNKSDQDDEKFKLPYPTTLLMIRKADFASFFEKNQLYDNESSYVAAKSSTNSYVFNNINKLISKCLKEKADGTATEDWDKVVFVPVKLIKDSSDKAVVAVQHDLELSSAKFIGGTQPEDDIELHVIYTKFNN
jgi:hypothetical protein